MAKGGCAGVLVPLAILVVTMLLASAAAVQKPLPLNTIKVPPGFRVDLYADGVENARSMALSPAGVLYIGTRTKGSVYAVVDREKDGKADRVELAPGAPPCPSRRKPGLSPLCAHSARRTSGRGAHPTGDG